jgi:hypothetical protein
MSVAGEKTTLGVGESQSPAARARLQKPILLSQILEDVMLAAVDPCAEQEQLDHPGWTNAFQARAPSGAESGGVSTISPGKPHIP